jgi:cysteine desulfurase
MEAYADKGRHFITSAIEHHAVSHTAEWLEKNGYPVTWLPVDSEGIVDPDDLRKAIRRDTTLVSVIMANNEIGTIQPISELAAITHEHGALFHSDAVQAISHIAVDVQALGIDMLSASAHKFHGPKGVGFLYIRKGLKTRSFLHGGGQERKRRASTENVAGIVGMARALDISMAEIDRQAAADTVLRDRIIDRLLDEVPFSRLNGHRTMRLPNNANLSFEFIEGESLLLALDQLGIAASTGSACASGSLDPSHVLLAIGLPHEIAHGSLRLTVGDQTTVEDVDYAIESVKAAVERLRSMSPLYEDYLRGKKALSAVG